MSRAIYMLELARDLESACYQNRRTFRRVLAQRLRAFAKAERDRIERRIRRRAGVLTFAAPTLASFAIELADEIRDGADG